ncbi:MAG TPA: adenylate/guanylate cyclase domain-containing protein [Candidatus Limnocylindrales bacterium]|nr:adenylate/guanylate cyclase domain-containing protein [Candidatus Limnocylindrales bacterium]
MTTATRDEDRPAGLRWSWAVLLVLPLLGLWLLLARPELDLQWEHHPSHFWLVLLTAAVNVVLAYATNVAAGRYRDARLVLVSLGFLASAGFLGLHALATPGVLLPHPNAGFVIATPVGLVIASLFAAASTSPLAGPNAHLVLRQRAIVTGGLFALMALWAILSVAGLPPLDGPPPGQEGGGPLIALAFVGVALFAASAWRYVELYRRRGGIVPLAVAIAFVLLAEALIAVALSRNWHLSWWEWHVLMLLAFAAIALGAQREYRRSGTLTAAFGGLYLEATLARIDRWHARAIAAVAAADERGDPPDHVLANLRREGATSDELALLVQAARELRRLDATFRPYLPSVVAERIRREPAVGQLGGVEREVSVLFADLAGFTTFSETRAPIEVIGMLNEYWASIVPVIDAAGGVIEHFAGDGVMAIFNAGDDQQDHPRRAAMAALAIVDAGRPLVAANPGWPEFRVGVNTGRAVVGNVGVADRRSFAVIGDTTNVAARLMASGDPGQVVVARTTWEALGKAREGTALGAVQVKGKRAPVEAWVLRGAG